MWSRKSLYLALLLWYSFSSGGEKPIAPATSVGDFGIGPEQLVMMSKDHNVASLQQYGGVSFQY